MILAQIYGAKASGSGSPLMKILSIKSWYLYATLVGAVMVFIGYLYGIKNSGNIWLVTLVSWASLVIAEVVLARLVFKTIPQGTVLIGFILVLAGFIIANL